MRQWIKTAGTMLVVLVFAAAAYAALTTVSGEVIKYETGKAISVRDFTGNVLALENTRDTKLEGDIKVGSQVSVEADGKQAKSVKVMASRAPGNPPGGFGGG